MENLPATIASNGCSPALWRQLTDSRLGYQQATEELSAHRDALTAALPAIEAAAAPCGPKAVVAELAPLVSLYGVPDKAEAEWKAFWGFYTAALSEVPVEALRAGVKDYVSKPDSEFFPKPGPLRALCDERARAVRTALGRARRVASLPENFQPSPEFSRLTPTTQHR